MALPVMRAVLLNGFGGPEMLEYREDVPVPQAGPGEVLIKVAACGVNNTDVWTREGAYGSLDGSDDGAAGWKGDDAPMSFPRIQGADKVGAVVDMGAGGGALPPGPAGHGQSDHIRPTRRRHL